VYKNIYLKNAKKTDYHLFPQLPGGARRLQSEMGVEKAKR
jgi:hypothetical protein